MGSREKKRRNREWALTWEQVLGGKGEKDLERYIRDCDRGSGSIEKVC